MQIVPFGAAEALSSELNSYWLLCGGFVMKLVQSQRNNLAFGCNGWLEVQQLGSSADAKTATVAFSLRNIH